MPVKALIVYYSRTGTTRKLAQALADAFGADVVEIRCDRYGRGPLRYLRAGYDSVKGNLPPIDMPQTRFLDYDLVLVGGPIWTSYPALPIRAFFAGKPELPARVGLFLTYGGHSPPDKAVAEVAAALPQPIQASLSLKSDDVSEARLAGEVGAFVNQLS